MLARTISDPDFWKHVSIPFVAGFVGWGTNWLAIRMMFRPLEFVGWRPPFGWQGIIPSKAEKMAGIFVDRTMFRLGTVQELFRSMDPDAIAAHVTRIVDGRLDAYTDEVMFYAHPVAWRLLPPFLQDRVRAEVRAEMPQLVLNLVRRVADDVENLVDFREMLVDTFRADRGLLNRLFLEAGAAEFRFIIRSGFYFGFAFGLAQLAVWTFYKSWWVLPAFGLLVGFATNWFAINIVFRPLRPRRIGPWTLHGLFLRRQKEVAAAWCRLVTREIVTLQRITYGMLYGAKAERTGALIRECIQPVADRVLDKIDRLGPIAAAAVGADARERIRALLGAKAVQVATDPFDHWPFNDDRARQAEQLLRERMEHLPSEEFQDLLRPCFQEDEWKLIFLGGVLGLLAGIAQFIFVFGSGTA